MIEHFYAALDTPHGIELETDEADCTTLIWRLYDAKKKAGNPALARVKIIRSVSEPQTKVWLALQPEEPDAEEA